MLIDCQTCPVRRRHCDDCVVPTLLQIVAPATGLGLDANESRAVGVFVDAGLVSAVEAAGLRARVEPWTGSRAVG